MLCGYWNFVLMSLHLGLHWSMILGMTGKKIPIKKPAVKWLLRILGSVIAVYGIYALTQRKMHEYLFGITKFAFIDESERIVFFLMDYLAIMGLFVFVSHYISTGLRYFIQGEANKNAGKNGSYDRFLTGERIRFARTIFGIPPGWHSGTSGKSRLQYFPGSVLFLRRQKSHPNAWIYQEDAKNASEGNRPGPPI